MSISPSPMRWSKHSELSTTDLLRRIGTQIQTLRTRMNAYTDSAKDLRGHMPPKMAWHHEVSLAGYKWAEHRNPIHPSLPIKQSQRGDFTVPSWMGYAFSRSSLCSACMPACSLESTMSTATSIK